MIVVLVALNVVGVTEAARLSITLAVIDFATQVLLVLLGFALVFSPETLTSNNPLGRGADLVEPCRVDSGAMLAYTGVETVSNLAEEARDPVRTVPNACKLVAVAVFAIYFTLPLIALSRCRSSSSTASTGAPRAPAGGGRRRTTRSSVSSRTSVSRRRSSSTRKIYVGLLAATILFIATNAGVIGASRITYSMASWPSSRGVPTPASASQDPVARARRVRGHRPDRDPPAGRRDLRRDAVLTRGDAVLHRRPRSARPDPDGGSATRGGAGLPRPAQPHHRGDRRLARVRDRGRDRDGDLVPRDRRREPGRALGGSWMARRRARGLRRLPPAVRRRVARRDDRRLPRSARRTRARVPQDRRPDRPRTPLRRRPRRGLPARGGARRASRCADGDRGAARSAARPAAARGGSALRTTSSTRPSRSATRTASGWWGGSSVDAARRRRSCARRRSGAPRSSCSGRRARTSSTGGAASSAPRSTV